MHLHWFNRKLLPANTLENTLPFIRSMSKSIGFDLGLTRVQSFFANWVATYKKLQITCVKQSKFFLRLGFVGSHPFFLLYVLFRQKITNEVFLSLYIVGFHVAFGSVFYLDFTCGVSI